MNLLALAESGKWLASNGWTALPQPQTRELCLQMETRIRGVCLQIKENKYRMGYPQKRHTHISFPEKCPFGGPGLFGGFPLVNPQRPIRSRRRSPEWCPKSRRADGPEGWAHLSRSSNWRPFSFTPFWVGRVRGSKIDDKSWYPDSMVSNLEDLVVKQVDPGPL